MSGLTQARPPLLTTALGIPWTLGNTTTSEIGDIELFPTAEKLTSPE